MNKLIVPEKVYIPIRRFADGNEWADISIVSQARDCVEMKLEKVAKIMPEWNVYYPVVRIGSFELKEIIEEEE